MTAQHKYSEFVEYLMCDLNNRTESISTKNFIGKKQQELTIKHFMVHKQNNRIVTQFRS